MLCYKCNAWFDGGDPKYCPRCAEEIGSGAEPAAPEQADPGASGEAEAATNVRGKAAFSSAWSRATALGKVSMASLVSGGVAVVLGLLMLFGGQTRGFTRATQRELAEMATAPVAGPVVGSTIKAIDKRNAFRSYMNLLKRWNQNKAIDSLSSGLRIEVALGRETPPHIRQRIRGLEQELASVKLLSKVGSANSYVVRVSFSSELGPGDVRNVAVFRSPWWETMADYSLVVLFSGFMLIYLGFGISFYMTKKLNKARKS